MINNVLPPTEISPLQFYTYFYELSALTERIMMADENSKPTSSPRRRRRMVPFEDSKPIPSPKRRLVPSEEFTAYCAGEFVRRRNADAPFDEFAYQEAMEMVVKKLHQLEEQGLI